MSRKMKTCDACWPKGTGNCRICEGKGYIKGGIFSYDKPCVKCKKSGRCTRCNGKGVVPVD